MEGKGDDPLARLIHGADDFIVQKLEGLGTHVTVEFREIVTDSLSLGEFLGEFAEGLTPGIEIMEDTDPVGPWMEIGKEIVKQTSFLVSGIFHRGGVVDSQIHTALLQRVLMGRIYDE